MTLQLNEFQDGTNMGRKTKERIAFLREEQEEEVDEVLFTDHFFSVFFVLRCKFLFPVAVDQFLVLLPESLPRCVDISGGEIIPSDYGEHQPQPQLCTAFRTLRHTK